MKQLFKNPILLLLLFTAVQGHAQTDSFRLLRAFRTDVVRLAVDNLDHLYVVSSAGQLKKFNPQGDSISTYNQVKRFGTLHTVDVTNPLKPLLFYKEFSTIVILDRLLSFRMAIDLRRLNIIQTSAIGLSYDNNIWLFDEYENKLKKINEDGTVLLQTPDLRTVFPEAVLPQQIIDQNGTVYLYDATNGLYLFDYYGAFKKKLPITGWQSIAVWNQYITGIQANRFQFYNMATLLSGTRPLPAAVQALPYFHLANNRIFSWTADSVRIYKYSL